MTMCSLLGGEGVAMHMLNTLASRVLPPSALVPNTVMRKAAGWVLYKEQASTGEKAHFHLHQGNAQESTAQC